MRSLDSTWLAANKSGNDRDDRRNGKGHDDGDHGDCDHDDDDDDDDDDHSGGGGSCSKKPVVLEMVATIQASGAVIVDVSTNGLAGTSIKKVWVKQTDAKGKRTLLLEFKKIPSNNGTVSLTIPASKGVKAGSKLSLKVHVKTCNGKATQVIKRDVLVGGTQPPPPPVLTAPDLNVTDIKLATATPGQGLPLQDAAVGVPTIYEVTIGNKANAQSALASCQVKVDGVALPAGAQFWVNGDGTPLGTPGQPVQIAGGTGEVCRFTITFAATPTPHTIVVSTTTAGEANPSDNSKTATINMVPVGNAPLVQYQWNLQQRDAVIVPSFPVPPGLPTQGIIYQTGIIQSYWQETAATSAGSDTWTIAVTTSTGGTTFTSRSVMNVSLSRITKQDLIADADGQICQTLAGYAAATRAYLSDALSLCATLTPDQTKIQWQLIYAFNNPVTYSDAMPYTGSDKLGFGATFTYTAEVTHAGLGAPLTLGGVPQTTNLFASYALRDGGGVPVIGPNIRDVINVP